MMMTLRSAVYSAVVMIAFAGPAAAIEAENFTVPKQAVEAKAAYCEECHGTAARGFLGYFPIPRLAGQQTEYFKNQLQAYLEQRRKNNIMFNVARVLSPAMITALATNFHELDPKPIGGASKALGVAGKAIFQAGIADADIPACASCHGPDAKGDGEIPRLAGQLAEYIAEKLANWDKERGQNSANPDTSAIMQSIARNLTDAQIKAVAAYLSRLE